MDSQEDLKLELQQFMDDVMSTVQGIETLEIIHCPEQSISDSSVHLVSTGLSKSSPEAFAALYRCQPDDPAIDATALATRYRDTGFSFTRISESNPNYAVFLFLSKEKLNDEKKGMAVIIYNPDLLFIATCKADYLRILNTELIAKMD